MYWCIVLKIPCIIVHIFTIIELFNDKIVLVVIIRQYKLSIWYGVLHIFHATSFMERITWIWAWKLYKLLSHNNKRIISVSSTDIFFLHYCGLFTAYLIPCNYSSPHFCKTFLIILHCAYLYPLPFSSLWQPIYSRVFPIFFILICFLISLTLIATYSVCPTTGQSLVSPFFINNINISKKTRICVAYLGSYL